MGETDEMILFYLYVIPRHSLHSSMNFFFSGFATMKNKYANDWNTLHRGTMTVFPDLFLFLSFLSFYNFVFSRGKQRNEIEPTNSSSSSTGNNNKVATDEKMCKMGNARTNPYNNNV